ncbi:MAG: arginase [Erysipelotrichia bacterium]|nr:arginase [Erysipelotrichia bacterium]
MKSRFFIAPQGAGVSKSGFEQIPLLLKDFLIDAEVVLPNNNESKTNNNNLKNLDKVLDYTSKLASKTARAIKEGYAPITIGGDHSVALGSILGASSKVSNLGVIWVDAHADMNTDKTSPSGNLHGMPLSALQGIGHPDLINNLPFKNFIKTENIVIIGTRSIDPLEFILMKEKKIKYYSYEDIIEKGLFLVLQEAKEYLSNKVKDVHISFDLDVMNPLFVPGVSTPVDDGLNIVEAFEIIDYFFTNMNVVSFDIVEYNPSFDKNNLTRDFVVTLIKYLKDKFV